MSRKLLAVLCAAVFAALPFGLSGCHYHGEQVGMHHAARAVADPSMHYFG